MAKRLFMLLVLTCFLAAMVTLAVAQEKKAEEPKHEYVGDDKCKMCHKKDGVHPSWLETKHAKAWESLKPEDQKKEECVGCHSTGTTAKGELLTGVQCEVCHGPGSDYKKMSIMKDREQAIANGLLIPDEKTCLQCHNEKVPEEFRAKEKFDYERMKATGIHVLATKEAEEKK
ncbi:MAG: cytochrome c3 family protein [candidate division Zixibacteria bacterium]|nr:cytochrome c3 family protein [candidate division Zixibacteria bacterium]